MFLLFEMLRKSLTILHPFLPDSFLFLF